MTYYEPNKSQEDDGFVTVTPPSENLPHEEAPNYQASPTYASLPQKPEKKSKVWVVVLVIVLVLLCCCCVLGGLGYYFFYYLGYTLEDFTLLSPLFALI